ncbi:FG-GAP-like repeat-containing protein [soil metagenome]
MTFRLTRSVLVPLAITAAMLTATSWSGNVEAAPRPADIAFRIQMIDPGSSETAAVADLNHDGRPDIVSADSWYEAPSWTKHPLRSIDYTQNYVDDFTDVSLDVDGDGWIDIIQFSYFAHNIVWLKNPGKSGGAWKITEIDNAGPNEFGFLVDLNNDGKAQELLPEIDRPNVPLAWYELHDGAYIKHTVAAHGFGHGIGVGDVNGDGRNDILTPKGWLEAPADVRAAGEWTFHATDWDQHPIPAAGHNVPVPAASPRGTQFGYMHLIDINGDGRKDLLTTMAHDYGLVWFEHTADPKNEWVEHIIDNTWSQAHASTLVDLNGDGQLDIVTGKRYFAHNGADPGEREPIGLYWYEYRKVPATVATATAPGNGGVEWIRHIVDYGGRMGGGMQIAVADMDGDGDLDMVTGGKAGLYLAENLTKLSATKAKKAISK